MRKWLLTIFVSLFLIGFSFAAPIDLSLAPGLVAIITVIFIGLMIMLSSVLSDPQIEAWAKNELREVIAGVIIIMIVLAIVAASNPFVTSLTGQANPPAASVQILDRWLASYDTSIVYIIAAMAKLRTAISYSVNLFIPAPYVSSTYGSNPMGGLAIFLGPLTTTVQSVTNVVYLFEGLRLLVVFFAAVIPPILLPLAFIARLLPFTRKLGNTLISVCLAALILMPFSIIFADYLNQSLGSSNPEVGYVDSSGTPNLGISPANMKNLDANPAPMVIASPLCNNVPMRIFFGLGEYGFAALACLPVIWAPYYPACFELMSETVYPIITDVFYGIFTLVDSVWELGAAAGFNTSYALTAYAILYPFLAEVSHLVLLAYLDFIVIALITIAGARSISVALGGEWYMAGIQRLV